MTQTLNLSYQGEIALLRLSSGATNAIGQTMLGDLEEALGQVRDRARGLVLAGGPKFFSMGMDLPALIGLDREGMTAFVEQFVKVIYDLFTLPLPTAAAIEGHAPAGGTILALACDYRFLTSQRRVMGLNESRLGITVPLLVSLILERRVGPAAAARLMLEGALIAPEEALAIGLADEILPPDQVLDRALVRLGELVMGGHEALAMIKQGLTRRVTDVFDPLREESVRLFVDSWFNPAARPLLKQAAAKF